MKTLLFTLEYPPFKGGVANYYGHVAQYWPLGESISVLDNNRGELMGSGKLGHWEWLKAVPILRRRIKHDQIDYVLVGQILPLGTAVWLLSLIQPIRYAVFLHGMDLAYAWRTPRKRRLATRILRRADRIIAANSYVSSQLLNYLPELKDRMSVVNPGIDGEAPPVAEGALNEMREHYHLQGQTVLFSLGRLVKRKGIDITIQALELIPEPLINSLRYFIAGTGRDEMYLKKLVPERFKEKIIFLGVINEEEKWRWLNLADIFIMPSRNIVGDFEGFGIVYLEANLCAKPVIAGRSGGVADAVCDNLNGLLVNPESPEDVKEAIIKLALDPNLRTELGRQGQARATHNFHWEKQVAEIFRIISQI